MSHWVRLWGDMPTDPKWRVVARRAKRPISEVISVFNFMMVNAGSATMRGTLENWNDEDVAAALDVEPEDIAGIRDAMQGKLLDGGKLTGWERRQPKREDNAAERARAWREEQKRLEIEAERIRTQANASERADKIRADTDKNREEDSSSLRSDECASADAPPPAEPKKRKVRKRLEETQMSEGSQPDKAQSELAEAAGLDDPAFRFHWRAFRSWHVTRGEWRKDWVQSWAKWIGGIPASQKIMAPAATTAQPRAAPPRPDPQEIRNPALRALQRLSQKNAQRSDDPDIFAAASDAGQRSPSDGSSSPETGASPGRFGPVLDLAAYR